MSPEAEAVIKQYRRDLKKQLRPLPKAQRQEILDEIEVHLNQSLERNGKATEAEARNVLDQLGDPAEIANEARERFGVSSSRFGGQELLALILLPVGGFVFGIGWIVGVILLWTSESWTVKEKLAGTLLPPGGLLLPTMLFGVALTSSDQEGNALGDVLLGVTFFLSIALAIVVPIWLGLRARTRVGSEPRNVRTA